MRAWSIAEGRRQILSARDSTPYSELQQRLAVVEDKLSLPRMIGAAAIAAFFSSEKPKERELARQSLLAAIEADLKKQGFISVKGGSRSSNREAKVWKQGNLALFIGSLSFRRYSPRTKTGM